MSSLVTVKLNKPLGASWGFRLQGGKDFATPLCIQKVNGGSVAAKAGLTAGDAIVSIGGHDALSLRHKEAQDAIVRAGNSFDLVIQRGMQTWRPAVTALPQVKQTPEGPMATSTSLAATPQEYHPIGTGHNTSAAPFGEAPQMINAQFNSPINVYSEESIAETLSAQAEVLGKGVLGINFKKYNREEKIRTDSPTYKLLHGEEEEAPQRKPRPPQQGGFQPASQAPFQIDPTVQQPAAPAPQAPPPSLPSHTFSPASAVAQGGMAGGLQPGENICFGCQRLIVGVFVRIKNKNLHSECFKCATCGTSLKNAGYYNINDKLYCDIHAKQAARQNPPAPNMVPVTIQPGMPTPSGAMTSPQARASAPFQPKAAPMPAPTPVRAPVSAPSVPASMPKAPVVAPNFQNSANPKGFGAPLGDVNVRAHIPRKDVAPSMPSFSQQAPIAPKPAPVAAPNFSGMGSMPKPSPIPGMGSIGGLPKTGAERGVQAPGMRTAPRRGKGVMNPSSASRIPLCAICQRQIRGPFVSALGKTWCPDHFKCGTQTCRKPIIEMGFVEEQGILYCEDCYERDLAPICGKCDKRIKGDCLTAVGKQFHPECFCCTYCGKVFGSGAFYLEDRLPYCETDWNDLFTTKCVGCNFPIEAGDRWVEALNSNYHSQCFKCSKCHKNLEGQSFFAKGGKPFCKAHAQRGF